MSKFYVSDDDMNINNINELLETFNLFDKEWVDDEWNKICKNKKTKNSDITVHDTDNDELDELLEELGLEDENDTKQIKEFNMNDNYYFDKYMESSLEPMIKEILKYFSKRYRKSSDNDPFEEDARYLYKQKEVDLFFKLNDNPNLIVEPQFDKGESIPWCWRISRIDKKK